MRDSPQVVANDFNCNIQCLHQDYNETNSKIDCPHNWSPRVTILCQDCYILLQHFQNSDRFYCEAHTAHQTTAINQRPISDDTFQCQLYSCHLSCPCPTRYLFPTPYHLSKRLKWAIHHQNWWHQQLWAIIILETKVVPAFPIQIPRYETREDRAKDIVITVWWKEIHWKVQALWYEVESAWIIN